MKTALAHDGFTLIEVLLAFGLMAIALVMVAPITSNMEKHYLQKTAIQFASRLRTLQEQALAEGTETRLQIDMANNRYAISRKNANKNTFYIADCSFVPSTETFFLQNNIQFDGAGTRYSDISYTPNGTVNRGNTITFKSNKYKLTMTIYVGSGNINIQKPEPL